MRNFGDEGVDKGTFWLRVMKVIDGEQAVTCHDLDESSVNMSVDDGNEEYDTTRFQTQVVQQSPNLIAYRKFASLMKIGKPL